jgi:hypothetical protein
MKSTCWFGTGIYVLLLFGQRVSALICHPIILDKMHVGIVSRSNMPILHVFCVLCVSPHVILVSLTCSSYSKEYFLGFKVMYKVMYLHNFSIHMVNLLL